MMPTNGDEGAHWRDETRSRLQAQIGDQMHLVDVLRADGPAFLVLARDLVRDREVILRILATDREISAAAQLSFERAFESATQLDHPNIVPVGELQGREALVFYRVQEVSASTLDSVLAQCDSYSLKQLLNILYDVASALDFAHAAGVVHGELEPASILLTDGGPAQVTAFGAGRWSATSRSTRSAAYIAPEQWQGDATIDGRTDVYALGVIAYELLTGKRRVTSVGAQGMVSVDPLPISHDLPLRAGAGAHVNAALMRAVSKRPSARFPTAGEFVWTLKGGSVTPVKGLPTQHPQLEVPPSRPYALLPMALVILVGIGLGIFAAPSARQSLRGSSIFRSILARATFPADMPAGSGSADAPRAPSTGTMRSGQSGSGSSASSGSMFPGAATAGGAGGASGTGGTAGGAPAARSSGVASSGDASGGGTASSTDASTASNVASTGSSAPADSTGYIRIELDSGSGFAFVDGVPRGSTPFLGRAGIGTHTVTIVGIRAIYPPNRQISVGFGDTAVASFSSTPPTPR